MHLVCTTVLQWLGYSHFPSASRVSRHAAYGTVYTSACSHMDMDHCSEHVLSEDPARWERIQRASVGRRLTHPLCTRGTPLHRGCVAHPAIRSDHRPRRPVVDQRTPPPLPESDRDPRGRLAPTSIQWEAQGSTAHLQKSAGPTHVGSAPPPRRCAVPLVDSRREIPRGQQ